MVRRENYLYLQYVLDRVRAPFEIRDSNVGSSSQVLDAKPGHIIITISQQLPIQFLLKSQ